MSPALNYKALLYATPTHLPSICPFTRPHVIISALYMHLPPVLWAWIRAPATHFLGARILTTLPLSIPPAAFSALSAATLAFPLLCNYTVLPVPLSTGPYLDMHRTGAKHVVCHMQKSIIQWSVISKFTCSSISSSSRSSINSSSICNSNSSSGGNEDESSGGSTTVFSEHQSSLSPGLGH